MKARGLSVRLAFLFLITLLFSWASADDQKAAEDIKYCEYIGDKLHYYKNAEQVYKMMEKKARIESAKVLYADQFKTFNSPVYSKNIILDKLAQTIQFAERITTNEGLFTPCLILKKPTITASDQKRFKKINVARVCNLTMNGITGLDNALRHRFSERLKALDVSDDKVLEYMVNDINKIKRTSHSQLYQLIHKAKDVQLAPGSLPDMKCSEFFVYPIELFVASS